MRNEEFRERTGVSKLQDRIEMTQPDPERNWKREMMKKKLIIILLLSIFFIYVVVAVVG